ncbi:endopeptidase La [Patescibacteria group bacterium]|nr:endopeptidase La [Patescibacteria group bacterium]
MSRKLLEDIIHLPIFLLEQTIFPFQREITFPLTPDMWLFLEESKKKRGLVGILVSDPVEKGVFYEGDIGVTAVTEEKENEVVFKLGGRFRVVGFSEKDKIVIVKAKLIEEEIVSYGELKGREPEVWALCEEVWGIIKKEVPDVENFEKIKECPIGEMADRLICVIPDDEPGGITRRDVLNKENVFERLEMTLARVADFLDFLGLVTDPIFSQDKSENVSKKIKAKKKSNSDTSNFKERFEKIKEKISPEAGDQIAREIKILSGMSKDGSEYHIVKKWLDFAIDFFSLEETKDRKNLRVVKKILNSDHCGLEKIKTRIFEELVVRRLNKDKKGPILCFVGPPGTGKTSLGMSIARATGRKFIRLSLGGVNDEADARGHSRTYVGALPGKILEHIKRSGSSNPVFMLDEIDKIGKYGAKNHGDIEPAMLEVLDPEQNHSFLDHFLAVPADLSKVMFITTANISETILPALRDRMEILELSGYTEEEKVKIAQKFLRPRQIKQNGLRGKVRVVFSKETLSFIIRGYTREAGVRNLERAIGSICRKIAVEKVAKNKSLKRFTVSKKSIVEFLGHEKYFSGIVRKLKPGVSIGLAWTPYGGEILYVESLITANKGKGDLILTGSLGGVIKESAQIARSYLRGRIGQNLQKKLKNDIHIHVPEGAVDKDGPSAGLAILFSLYSCFKNQVLRKGVAVTGEITLIGEVLPVGGIKEKIIGAARAGIEEIILPKGNGRDLSELPASLKRKMKFHLVENAEEALDKAFGRKKGIKNE